MSIKISIIIPAFNEEKVIGDCLKSLLTQNYPDYEIIVVDDGSSDSTKNVVDSSKVSLFQQNHLGAGAARNLGAKNAKGEILVFVDADMVFDKNFINNLTRPIRERKAVGTFSKEEYVLNKENIWSKCWNINKQLPFDRMHPLEYPNEQPVFRAILKSEFDRIKGFDLIGYIDDYTLSEKLGILAQVAPQAIFYHKNPETLQEVFQQARWIGKNEFKKRKVKNEFLMKLISILRYSLIFSIFYGFYQSIKYQLPQFIIFKIIYDLAIEISLIKSFSGEQKYK